MYEQPIGEAAFTAAPAADGLVECRSDSAYAGRPLAFTFQGQRFEVADVLSRWRAPDGTGFRVSIRQGRVRQGRVRQGRVRQGRIRPNEVFELFYHESLDGWSIREV
jgi:hypothetical protein